MRINQRQPTRPARPILVKRTFQVPPRPKSNDLRNLPSVAKIPNPIVSIKRSAFLRVREKTVKATPKKEGLFNQE